MLTAGRFQDKLPTLILLGLPALAYLPSLGNGFVWDDHGLITQDPWVQSLDHVGFLFSPEYWNQYFVGVKGQYRPLRALSFALQLAIWGPNPMAFHAFNLALHVLNTWLLRRTLSKLGFADSVSWLAALLFALHPAHTEVVVWIKNRTEEMGMFFSLLCVLCYLQLKDAPLRARQIFFAVLCCCCCAMALLSKETALVVPFIILTHALACAPSRWRALTATSSALIPVCVYLLFKFRFLRSEIPGTLESIPLPSHLALIANTIGNYLTVLVFPVNLNADRPFSLSGLAQSWETWVGVAVMIGASAWAFWLVIRRRPLPLLALCWLFMGLAPVSNVFFLATRPLADQRLYFPSVGFCLLAAMGARFLRQGPWGARGGRVWISPLVTAATVVVLGLFMAQVIDRHSVWRDDLSLIKDTIARSPDSTRPHMQMAIQLMSRGDLNEAAQELLKTIELSPNIPEAHNLLGVIFTEQKSYERAISHFRRAVELRPSSADALANMAIPLVEIGRVEEARASLERALELAPKDPHVLTHLGIANGRMGRYSEAMKALQRALEIQPSNLKARVYLAYAYAELGDLDRCIEALRGALSEHPESIGLRIDLSTAYRKKGQPDLAYQLLQEALSMDPSDPRVHTALGNLAANLGQWEEARKAFEEAARLVPHQALVQYNLGQVLLDAGKPLEAERPLRLAVEIEPRNPAFVKGLMRVLRELGKESEAQKYEQVLKTLESQDQRPGSTSP